MWKISLSKDPLDETLTSSNSNDNSRVDLTKSQSVIVKVNTNVKDLISATFHNDKARGEIIDAFEEGGRIARTTLSHLFSNAIADSCPTFSDEQSMYDESKPSFVLEPLYFMRRWKKIQQIRARKIALNGREGSVKRTKVEIETSSCRKPSTYFPPYILERTDVWCDTSNISCNLAIILENNSNDNFDEVESNVKDFVSKYMDCVTKTVIQDKTFLSHVANSVMQTKLRNLLPSLNAVAFMANDSIMPRKSGASFAPMSSPPAIPFIAPGGSKMTKQVTINMGKLAKFVANKNVTRSFNSDEFTIVGMVIPKGITLIVGGGYHGKSTMLRTIMAGVYDKTLGDGRELCVTDSAAITVRAEDGRYVNNTNVR